VNASRATISTTIPELIPGEDISTITAARDADVPLYQLFSDDASLGVDASGSTFGGGGGFSGGGGGSSWSGESSTHSVDSGAAGSGDSGGASGSGDSGGSGGSSSCGGGCSS
jgi:hypothetical protein